ncbi:sensor histidine kinase [Streptomyces boninensis]|uniref:sensor histidine kinase n=1 Tax=Streptomyces boninensis TaxID=2039455 RepID=UPI003B226FBA
MKRSALHAETPGRGVPGRFRGPFTRWPRGADAVLAVALFLWVALLEEGPENSLVVRPAAGVLHPAPLLVLVAAAAIYVRRTRPVAVVYVVLAMWAPTLGSSYSTLGVMVLVALYSAGRHADDSRWGPLGIAAAIVGLTIDGVLLNSSGGEVFFSALVMAGVWYLGRRLRLRAGRAVRLVEERAAAARRIVAEERTHIARELHDVVAHRVSMMTVQAGAARMVAAEDPQGALEAMAAVEEAGRQALDELRHLLGVLRPEAGRDGLGPRAGLADLPRLVAEVREAGLDLSVSNGIAAPLPARVDLSAYRIVQEALTNVLKHSGPRTRTEVRLTGAADGLTIEVTDDGRGAAALAAPAGHERPPGHGIVGMRERTHLLGGHLDAGPRPAGGFRLTAYLPVKGEPS